MRNEKAEKWVFDWLDHLGGLNGLDLEVKKMFGCYCLYCDGTPVGWIQNDSLSLREVGLTYLPKELKRPLKTDRIQEIVIPFDYVDCDWLRNAIQDTADFRNLMK